MKPELRAALSARLLAMADDELILGHRDSEWCGHAPILEEDIAFANIALDEIGHAIIWYNLLADMEGEEQEAYANYLVYHREVDAFRCAQIVEHPKDDWAFSMLRQYLFDLMEKLRLEALMASKYQPLAEAAAKIRPEEIYHLRHTSAWVRRLGLGTDESNHRMQAALDQLWPLSAQLFERFPYDELLIEAHIYPDMSSVQQEWGQQSCEFLSASGLTIPKDAFDPAGRTQHTVHLPELLAELQSVARAYPDARW